MTDEYKYTIQELSIKYGVSIPTIRTMAAKYKMPWEPDPKKHAKGGKAAHLYRWSDWEPFHKMAMQARNNHDRT